LNNFIPLFFRISKPFQWVAPHSIKFLVTKILINSYFLIATLQYYTRHSEGS